MTAHNTQMALQFRATTDRTDAGDKTGRQPLGGAELELELENVALEELEAASDMLDRLIQENKERET